MEILTDATLSKLLAECAKYENYIGAILFESRDREAEFLNEIKSLGNDWTINVRLGRIKCKNNNSHIYTFTINRNFEEKIRGMEFNSMRDCLEHFLMHLQSIGRMVVLQD